MPETAQEAADCDERALMGGRARLRQPLRGYRAGMDAALLAAAIEARPGESVLELGCGAGGALVQAALRTEGARFIGVERDEAALALAKGNLLLNDLAGRCGAVAGEVAAGFAALELPRVDAAFANPPFFDDAAALRPPAPERRGAWMAEDGLDAWCAFLLDAVREGGRVTLIHRADRLPDLLAALTPRAGSLAVRGVHPFADAAAKRVLVRAVRGARGPLRLLPPLVLNLRGEPPTPTAEAQAVLRGEAALPW